MRPIECVFFLFCLLTPADDSPAFFYVFELGFVNFRMTVRITVKRIPDDTLDDSDHTCDDKQAAPADDMLDGSKRRRQKREARKLPGCIKGDG